MVANFDVHLSIHKYPIWMVLIDPSDRSNYSHDNICFQNYFFFRILIRDAIE